ncbi:hypothetical protein MCUN1_001983 [Malassezia cuniculi]|uniref:Protein IVY1 n=1 Tax=Malassezia cuniculi TaxID=948313 RepID=A0AAF0EV79_9BASI|nr:hypothetical protein MCUN1_001983 [Malassezia cuniculi]
MPHPVAGLAPSVLTSSGASDIVSYSAISRASTTRPQIYVRRADIGASLAAYERLLAAIKSYTTATLAMSQASSELAGALEECSHIKGAHSCGEELQAAGGLHYLKSNYDQVLCDTFWKEISIPLLSNLDSYKATVHERQMLHERAVAEKSRVLKDIERKNQREGKKRERDLSSYRTMLTELQAHVDELEELKLQHYHEVLEGEESTWQYISSKIAMLVRVQSEICDRIATKATVDPVLESMTSAIPDPFDSYGPQKRDGELFTILPPSSFASGAIVNEEFGANEQVVPEEQQDVHEPSSTETRRIFSESGDESDVPRSLATSKSYSSLFGKRPNRHRVPISDTTEEDDTEEIQAQEAPDSATAE